jgi:hypothetical protein
VRRRAHRDIAGLLSDGDGHEPAVLLATLRRSPPPPLSGIVELMGEVESRGAAAEVEDSHVRGMHGSDGGGVSWGRRRGSEEGRGMVHTHCGGDEHVRRRNIRLGVFCVC